MALGAYQITVLPGARIRFKDHKTGEVQVVIIDDEIEVQAVRDYPNLRVSSYAYLNNDKPSEKPE